jgi:hypothetical protein
MKIWTSFTSVMALSVTAASLEGCPPVRAQQATVAAASTGIGAIGYMEGMDMGTTHSGVGAQNEGLSTADSAQSAPSSGASTAAESASAGQVAFNGLKQLFGKWEAPMGSKTLVDTFQPFAFGTAILAEEWLGDQQITSTVFYLVGSQLRADHYCDYGNQPRYVAVPSADPSIIQLDFRAATNLDTHPTHFHSTTWHLIDATHMTQDWNIEGSPKGKSTAHLQFVRRG